MKTSNNSVAKVLRWTGIIFLLLSFLGGIALGNAFGSDTEFNGIYLLASWVGSFMFSLIFFGIAEIIDLLQLQKEETTKLLAVLITNETTNIKTPELHNNINTFEDLPDL